METVLKPIQDLIVIACVLFAFVGTGMMVIWFATKNQMSRLDQVEILTMVQSFIPDNVWLLVQTIKKYKAMTAVAIMIATDVLFLVFATQKIVDGSWSLFLVLISSVLGVLAELLLVGSYCVYKENQWDTHSC